MTNVIDIVPKDAVTIANTPEYTAWKSADSSEVFIDMKETETNPFGFVDDIHLNAVLQRNVEELGNPCPKKVHVPASGNIDFYTSDFGTFDIIDLRREDEKAVSPKAKKAYDLIDAFKAERLAAGLPFDGIALCDWLMQLQDAKNAN